LKVGVYLQVVDLERGQAIPVAELAARAARAEALGFDSVWVMDHFFLEWEGRRVFAHDPMVQLAAMAAATRQIRLGPLVLGSPFREPAQVAREAASLQDLSRGRLILGLGCGWYEAEFEAAGVPFDHLVGRFEKSLQRLVPMLREACSADGSPPPPIWIAAAGPRMLGLTARWADGWNLAWGGPDTGWYADAVEQLRGALRAAGRPESAVTRSAGISVVPLEDAEAGAALERARRFARGDRDLNFVQGGPPVVAAAIKAYAAAGADHVILNLSSSPVAPTDPEYLERAAEALALVR
jgi:alkanesulfonate monooxygenase SsuD/methylene tetrahydromethanopterin reductase-like flavin-dependent oxidoreductase (luciferase family)